MKDYYKLILSEFVESYERREIFAKREETVRAIQVVPEKEFKEYTDRYNHDSYREINVAIEKIVREGLAEADYDDTGKYLKIRLLVSQIDEIYKILKKKSIPLLCEKMRSTLIKVDSQGNELILNFCKDQIRLLEEFKKLPYEIGYDNERLVKVIKTLKAIMDLKQETYIRNFSTAIYKDSKEFQKTMRNTMQNILYDYSDVVVEKERILEMYNLFDNPTYVMIKGNAELRIGANQIILSEINGGIAIPNVALKDIYHCKICIEKVITVENLTTFHDTDEDEGVIIYLGGFHNETKQRLLELIYSQNKNRRYLHKGDIDVYGFAILENLKEKTGIPFEPLEMDLETLKKFYKCGLYKKLTATDKKAMKSNNLLRYKEIFDFMVIHDCKVEQESLKAVKIICDQEHYT